MSFIHLSRLILVVLLAQGLWLAGARAQDPDSAASVADAAKRARDQKQNAASRAKVITDDDVDAKSVKPGAAGLTVPTPQSDAEPPSAAAVAAAESADAKAAKSPPDDPVKKTDPQKLKALKADLAQAEDDLKLSQRELSLEQDTVFSSPDYQHDTAGKAKLDALQQQIGDRQQKVEDVKARLAALEEELRKEGTDPDAAEKPAEPPPN
jgi:hypothetical protein